MYAAVLGDSWHTLHETIRRFHEPDAVRRADGVFRVRRGTNPIARSIAWLGRMPPAGDTVRVSLVVTPKPDGEQWRRMFGAAPLVSSQSIDRGSIVERFGAIEVRFDLAAVDGALHYRFAAACVRLAGLAMPIPLVASASERPSAAGGIDVSVDVGMKTIGRVIAYEGTLTRLEVER